MRIPIVCPSKGRAENVLTKKVVSPLIIVCPENEREEYVKHNSECEVICPPESVVGIAATRQWILEKYDTVFMIDDDCLWIYHIGLKTGTPTRRLSQTDVADLIQATYEAALDINAGLFGFNNSKDIRMFDGLTPYKFSGYVLGQAMGVIAAKKNNLMYDTRYLCADDYYISLLNAYHNRYIYKDQRFGTSWEQTGYNAGGNSMQRNLENEKEDFLLLKKQFGDAVQAKRENPMKKTGTNGVTDQNKISNRHPYERTINLPF